MRKDKKVKSLKEYNQVEFDKKASLKARKINRKMPTSVSLPQLAVEELKKLAAKKGIPYQVLMRSYILEGIDKAKKEEA